MAASDVIPFFLIVVGYDSRVQNILYVVFYFDLLVWLELPHVYFKEMNS